MEELKNHVIYEVLKTKYPRLALDYVVLSAEKSTGIEAHKAAVIKALKILSERYDRDYTLMEEKMRAEPCGITELLKKPEDDYYDDRKKVTRGHDIPTLIPYWYAFLEPPYSVPYMIRDFIEFNGILFPNRQDTEVYRWSDDFSDYFDDGKEWWGTALWSAYDKAAGIFVIIGASVTD